MTGAVVCLAWVAIILPRTGSIDGCSLLIFCVMVMACVDGAIIGWRKLRPPIRQKRIREGLCPWCGYDVRASAERCPECGARVLLPGMPLCASGLPNRTAREEHAWIEEQLQIRPRITVADWGTRERFVVALALDAAISAACGFPDGRLRPADPLAVLLRDRHPLDLPAFVLNAYGIELTRGERAALREMTLGQVVDLVLARQCDRDAL